MPLTGNKETLPNAGPRSAHPSAPKRSLQRVRGLLLLEQWTNLLSWPCLSPGEGPAQVCLEVTLMLCLDPTGSFSTQPLVAAPTGKAERDCAKEWAL